MSNLGGWTPEQFSVTEEVKKICTEVKTDIEKEVGTNFPVYTPMSFRLQIVAGINYLVKVNVGEGVCVHAMIFQNFQRNLNVAGVEYRKTPRDPLEPF